MTKPLEQVKAETWYHVESDYHENLITPVQVEKVTPAFVFVRERVWGTDRTELRRRNRDSFYPTKAEALQHIERRLKDDIERNREQFERVSKRLALVQQRLHEASQPQCQAEGAYHD